MPKKRKKKDSHYHKGTYVSTKTGAEMRYRSGWELSYMKWLDSNLDVRTYLYEGIVIGYLGNVRSGKMRRYYPDFLVEYIDGTKKLVEVKPSRKLANKTVQKKLAAASYWCEEHGASLEVISEIELKELGLL